MIHHTAYVKTKNHSSVILERRIAWHMTAPFCSVRPATPFVWQFQVHSSNTIMSAYKDNLSRLDFYGVASATHGSVRPKPPSFVPGDVTSRALSQHLMVGSTHCSAVT
jgi:hypothetical protein